MNFKLESKQLALDLSLSKSSIEFSEVESEEIEIEFTGLRKKTVEEVFTISFRNDRLVIKERSSKRSPMFDSFFNSGWSSDLAVKIPTGTSISGSVSTMNGDIMAGKLDFSGSIKTMAGKIKLNELISDDVTLQNVGGSIQVGKFEGFLKARSMAGRISINEGLFKELIVKGMAGDVSVTGEFDLQSDGEISTMSGGVHLNITEYNGDSSIMVSTLSGTTDVIGDYPDDAVQIKRRMPFFKNHPFKSFFPNMKSACSSFFTSSDDDDIEVETETVKEDENVKLILEMLSQGKITADEAEKLIKALGKND